MLPILVTNKGRITLKAPLLNNCRLKVLASHPIRFLLQVYLSVSDHPTLQPGESFVHQPFMHLPFFAQGGCLKKQQSVSECDPCVKRTPRDWAACIPL